MGGKWTIYHGSQDIIKQPSFGKGKPHNDYGQGFYCTRSSELAKEWSTSEERDGFANCYQLDAEGLTVLNLNHEDYHILNWLAILLENRQFKLKSDASKVAYQYILEMFLPEYKDFDIILGYRADDSYFAFASAFLNNSISLSRLCWVMALGELGEQVVIRSRRAFDCLTFAGAEPAAKNIYYPKKKERDENARNAFRLEQSLEQIEAEVYMIDILRGRWKNDDARLQRNLFA